MPKAKTHQATAKRYIMKKSKKGIKIYKRSNGQDHFNSRETGNTRRNKRSDVTISNAFNDTIKKASQELKTIIKCERIKAFGKKIDIHQFLE